MASNSVEHMFICINEKKWDTVDKISAALYSRCAALHAAITNGAPLDTIIQLVTATNVNSRNHDGNIALHLAMAEKRWDLAAFLLQFRDGIDAFAVFFENSTLYKALKAKAPKDIISELVSRSHVNLADKRDRQALYWAIYEKHWDVIPILLENGADINANCDKENQNIPLHIASRVGAPIHVLRLLVSIYPSNINYGDGNCRSAIFSAIWWKQWHVVEYLLYLGADIARACPFDHFTPLHVAIEKDAPSKISLRLKNSDNIDAQDSDGRTPLHCVLRSSIWNSEPNFCITWLITPRNLNMKDAYGFTALHEAVRSERWQQVQVLLVSGADINLIDNSGNSPLQLAADSAVPIDLFVRMISPRNVNMKDSNGQTALQYAVSGKRWDLVNILLQYGAHPFLPGVLPEPEKPYSLRLLTIFAIRNNMPEKTDQAYEGLDLPMILDEIKMQHLGCEIKLKSLAVQSE